MQPAAAAGCDSQVARDPLGVIGDANRMPRGKRTLGIDHLAKRDGDRIEILVVDGVRLLGRGEPYQPRIEEWRRQTRPEGIVRGNPSKADTSSGSSQLPERR